MEITGKKIVTLDGNEAEDLNWLRYVNCAKNKDEQNLIAIQCQSRLYYETCKSIPANTELLVWYQDKLVENINNQKEEISSGYNCTETQNKTSISSTERKEAKETKKVNQYLQTHVLIPTFVASTYLLVPNPLSPVNNTPVNSVPTLESNNGVLVETMARTSVNPEKGLIFKKKHYECKVCHKKYARKQSLREHKRDHTGERPYQCNICKKRFKRRGYLKAHEVHHSTHRPFKCELCQKSYKVAPSLKLHKLKEHIKERPFQCKVCNKHFFQKTDLNRHTRLHTGEKPYECHFCHKKFRTSSCLRIHLITHTEEKRHECEICHARFAGRNSLSCHKRIHTGEKPYECKVCHKKFRFDSPFRTHMKIHAEKKSFQCEICHDTFTKRCTAKNCCKQSPFKCNTCNNEYVKYDDFLRHKNMLHKNSTLEVAAQSAK